MRIKCPNSDIYLELPGDRTDMKFTCPACHKVHRVTVSISTPGEDPQPASETGTSMMRSQPAVPKKYATGAYPPVVDIPIDANFVLLDGSETRGESVDLGAAAEPPPPRMDEELSNRRTEIYRDREKEAAPPPRPETPADAATPVDDDPAPEADDAMETVDDLSPKEEPFDGRAYWDEASEAETASRRFAREAAAANAGPSADEPDTVISDGDDASVEPERQASPGRRGRPFLWLFLVVIIALAGFFGWQQYLHMGNQTAAAAALAEADAAWKRGDAPTAERHVAEAEAALRRNEGLYTLGNLWRRAAAVLAGGDGAAPTGDVGLDDSVKENLDLVRTMESFRAGLDPASTSQMAGALRDATLHPGRFALLGDAMQAAAIDAALGQAEADAGTTTPETLVARANAEREFLLPELSPARRQDYDQRLDALIGRQREAFEKQIRGEIAGIADAADAGKSDALVRYLALEKRLYQAPHMGIPETIPAMAPADRRASVEQLSRLASDIAKAQASARSVLSRPESDDSAIDDLMARAEDDKQPNPAMAEAAVSMIDVTRSQADDLLRLRAEVYGRVQSEVRRGRDYPGTRIAWSLLRIGFDDPSVQIDPSAFRFDSRRARMDFVFNGIPVSMEMGEDDYETRIRARVDGYRFSAGWVPLFHKPLTWMAGLARAMRAAGVSPDRHAEWELLEGPGGPLALSVPVAAADGALPAVDAAAHPRHMFFEGRLRRVDDLPLAEDARQMVEDFRLAAIRLHDGVMADESISQTIRQALKPVLMGTYQQPDARDYFDSAFCRRLIEADYLESFIKPMPAGIAGDLAEYRETLGRLEAGYDDFRVPLDDGRTLFAVARLDADISGGGRASDQDPETGETIQRYAWRVETPDSTVFYSPMPSRFFYAFTIAEHYPGSHKARPAGVPALTEIHHATQGLVASYESGADRASGDDYLWNRAIAEDLSGRVDPSSGPPGWNFPLHVIERDDQGDPVTLATLSGIVKNPDFSKIRDDAERRRAEDEWLDSTAATLATPGELGLIFHQFFRYCSDSPLPELPNLIGSHYGLSDTHQTVYQSMERRWVGRLIGDCDDLAEFFQVLTRRQGKLSHVMQLPSHAACGYVEKISDDNYRFVLLQTGPTLQFNAATLNEVVETAYRFFDRGEGISHMTTDAVPLLLRFADEETRTPFVLSARIYEDPDYAETMIQVQAYWHEHVYSAAIEVMEELVRVDQEIGNIKELGSLYERVGFYDKSQEMRYRELEMVKDKPQAALSTLLEIVQLHFQEKDRARALEALERMEARMQAMVDADDVQEFFRAITFRSFWAIFLSRLNHPDRAWNLIKYDVLLTKRQLGRIADPVLRTLLVMYERMCMIRDSGAYMPDDAKKAMADVRRELTEAFGRGYFKPDDSYNTIITRYYILGRFAVSDIGRDAGLKRLREDGPYAEEVLDQTRRTRALSDDDWKWFRIAPQLYLSLGLEMLDRDEYPELFDPEGAKPLLEDVSRAVRKGTGLGSDVAGGDDVVKADMMLSFINRDLAAFRRCLEVVKEKDYASLYDDAALVLGLQGGLIPLDDFPEWIEAFREFFPGSQHYFKVVYRAIDKENYDHALIMAEATARFFPEDDLLRREAEFVRSIIPGLKQRKQNREFLQRHGVGRAEAGTETVAAELPAA